jgi:2-phosphoglycerate kinase
MKKMVSKNENRKGVVLVRYEDGTKHLLTKYIYNRMMESGKRPNIVLLKKGLHWDDLK